MQPPTLDPLRRRESGHVRHGRGRGRGHDRDGRGLRGRGLHDHGHESESKRQRKRLLRCWPFLEIFGGIRRSGRNQGLDSDSSR